MIRVDAAGGPFRGRLGPEVGARRGRTEQALRVEWLGRVEYAEAVALQERAVAERASGRAGDRLLLLEHPPVITLGRGARCEHLLVGEDELAARGVAVHLAQRGGDVTYHAPGQLVGYPILDLRARGAADVHAYLRGLEAALIAALATLGVPARRIPGMTGVFVARPRSAEPGPERKLASIGVGLRRWITFHGFALNVSTDLEGFRAIVPCGLHGVEMTSVARELGAAVEERPALDARARGAVADAFRAHF
jgi:lipoyl(octanoyl) transferase